MKSSVAAILNYDGANDEFKKALRLAKERRELWRQWAAHPARQADARAYAAALHAQLGDDLAARRLRMQRESCGDGALHGPRALVLEPKRPASIVQEQQRQQPGGGVPAAGSAGGVGNGRRHVDPVLLDLGLVGPGPADAGDAGPTC